MNVNYLFNLNRRSKAILVAHIVFPIGLFFVPLEWLIEQHSICIVKNIFGTECPGCGMTRAVISAIQFEFVKAFEFNKLVTIVLPIFTYVWIKQVIKYFNESVSKFVLE